MVIFENVTLAYGKRTLIENLSFRVKRGEKAAVSGRSGSGKSSILKMIMGFAVPLSGRVIVDGMELAPAALNKIRTRLAWVPQAFERRGSTLELIRYPFTFRENRKIAPELVQIKRMLDAVGLEEEVLDKDLENLSGGQRHRIALVIACLLNRPLMLLDEATAALDKQSKKLVMDLLFNMDVTILAASHDADWLSRCDQVIEIGDRE